MILLFDKNIATVTEAEVKPYVGYQEFGVEASCAPVEEEETQEASEEEAKGPEESEESRQNRWREAMEEEYRQKITTAEQILDQAKAEAEKLREEARQEGRKDGFEEGKRLGYTEGYADGEREAMESHREACQKELDDLQNHIAETIRDMGNQKNKVLEKYLDNLKDISLAVAEKIIQTSLKSSSEIIKRMIVVSTEKLKKVAWAKIYVGRSGTGLNVQGDTELLHELTKLSDNVKIVVMNEEPGTCIIELPSEIIDVSVGTQLENIRGILENARL